MKPISKSIVIALCGSLLILATGCQKKYFVSGETDSEMNNKYAYIYSINDPETAIDSVQIADGKFSWEISSQPSEDLFFVQLPESSRIPFVIEESELKINLEESTTRGGKLNDDLADYLTAQQHLMEQDSVDDRALLDLSKAFFDKYKNLPMSVFAIDMARRTVENSLDLEYYLEGAGERVRTIPMIQEMIANFENLKKTAPGNMFVDFEGVDDAGQPVKLSDYVGQGQYVLVDFWASWCPPCRAEIPFIKEVFEKYKNKGLAVVGVAVGDTMEDHLKAVEKLQITWAQINDTSKVATKLYGISGIPQIMLIGPDGKIIKRDLREKAIEEAIVPLFQ